MVEYQGISRELSRDLSFLILHHIIIANPIAFVNCKDVSSKKFLITPPNGPPLQDEVWIEPFQRLARVEGAKPSSPPQRRKIILAISLVLSLWLLAQRKNGAIFRNVTSPNSFRTFSWLCSRKKKYQKEQRISGRCPVPRRLLKKAGENFHPVEVIRSGEAGENVHPGKAKRLSQKLLIKRMAQPFAMSFCKMLRKAKEKAPK